MSLFGNDNERSFMLVMWKSFALLIPGAILGHYVDTAVKRIQKKQVLGSHVGIYVLFQSLINITIIYLLHLIHQKYTSEFQRTLPGLYFSVLFFGLQSNYISNVQRLLGGAN